MRRKFFVLPLFAALMLVAALGTGMRCISATATLVTDGNSFDAKADSARGWGNASHVPQGDEYHVRLIGVEAPTGDQCYAQEATDYLKSLIEGKKVCLMPDMGSRDSNGQLFAYVAVSSDPSTMGCDVFVNADMVLQGYARADAVAHPGVLRQVFEFLQCQAYSEGRGMWGACPDLPPPEKCGPQPTPAPEQTATPAPTESTATPTANPSLSCCRPCTHGHRCVQPQGCNCDNQ
jgi:endonuclease YncB( thermonuclease family)